MLPKKPDSELVKDSNPLVEAMFNYQLIHVEAYVVHVDMVSQHEVAFKLTPDSIDDLVKYHKDIYSVDVSASTWSWAEKEVQLKKLHEEFVQAINKFVFRAPVRALEGLEEDGAGELLEGRSEDVKNSITQLFLPLLPPPPRIVDVVRPQPLLPSSHGSAAQWWPQTHALPPPQPAPVESWKVLSSTPSPTVTSCSDGQPQFWPTMGMQEVQQLPSPTPSFSQPYCSNGDYYTPPPQSTASPELVPYTTASLASLPLPSTLMSHNCGSAASGGYTGYGWSYNDFSPQYAATM
jgi:hypothetical protein